MVTIAQQPASLRSLVRAVTEELSGDQASLLDMSRAGALEHDPSILHGHPSDHHSGGQIQRLEGSIRSHDVPRHIGTAPIRYFLDGSQKTLPIWRVGTTPIITAVIAVAILERTAPTDIRIVPNSLVAQLHWIIPRYTADTTINRMVDLLESMGERVVDPLESIHRENPDAYRSQVGSYVHVLEHAYSTASNLRARKELDVLAFWERDVASLDRKGWIVVDGQLKSDTPNAIGLVKRIQAQHLTGSEANVLYNLSPEQRTSAFSLLDEKAHEQADRTMWYLRMHNAMGRDARHGLIRLETPAILTEPELVDQISSWILAERAPRPSTDARWPTLLYPIHLLERILKSRIGAMTSGWPS